MTIAIDCRMLDSSGVGIYLKECLTWFLISGYDFLLLGNIRLLNSFSLNANVKIIECNIRPFSLKELFFFPSNISRQINKADVYYSPYFNIPCGIFVPIFTTIHDIIFPDMPELTSKTGLAIRMWFYRRAYKKSKKIFTVSNYSKSRVEHHLGNTKPVIVSPGGIQQICIEYGNCPENIRKINTIVFVGNIKKHKGLDCLIQAFQKAMIEGLSYKLIIIGSKENFRSGDNSILHKIDALGSETVSFTGYIPDKQLMEYISQASLLIQPSLYEGFGFPPLEAMVLGTHALISDIPVFKEIYDGFPVTFFRAGDSDDLKNKMIELLLNKTPPSPVLSNALLTKYSFEKTASIILKELK
ncbi:MAG: glycosyltransferase family 4 protein [Treponema sp.]|nr:glycosyltransferase family 4 protein [Treponema sp.]